MRDELKAHAKKIGITHAKNIPTKKLLKLILDYDAAITTQAQTLHRKVLRLTGTIGARDRDISKLRKCLEKVKSILGGTT